MKWVLVAFGLSVFSGIAGADPSGSVTIYSESGSGAVDAHVLRNPGADGGTIPGYAMVREWLKLPVSEGISELRYTDLPASIDPASALLEPEQGSGVRVLAQRFQSDLVNEQFLLRQYVGQQVEVDQAQGGQVVTTRGKLLHVGDHQLILESQDNVQVLRDYSSVRLPTGDRPLQHGALIWSVQSEKAHTEPFMLQYETGGMTWWASYRALVSGESKPCRLQLSSRATVVNRSGHDYGPLQLNLVAGQLHRASTASPDRRMRAAMLEAAPSQGFSQQALSEYHLYRLARPVTLLDGATQQFPLLPETKQIPCSKELLFDASQGRYTGSSRTPIVDPAYGMGEEAAVTAYLVFQNSKRDGLGEPLPAGKVSVLQTGAQGQPPEFIGEDNVRHTAADEQVRLALGTSIDVVGERTQTDFKVDNQRRTMEEQIEIRLRNHKSHPVEITVNEPLPRWRQWQIVESSQEYRKIDANTVEFVSRIPADGESVIRYRARYTW